MSYIDSKLAYIRLCTIRSALKLEMLGMKRSRSPSAYVIAKRDLGITGNRANVLEQLELLIEKQRKETSNVIPLRTS